MSPAPSAAAADVLRSVTVVPYGVLGPPADGSVRAGATCGRFGARRSHLRTVRCAPEPPADGS
eukprot:gene32034-31252_t